MVAAMERHVPVFRSFGTRPGDPPWNRRNAFSSLDGAAVYAMVRAHRPRRILEIGSGISTRFLLRAIADLETPCELVCIDPVPRVEIASLGVTHLPRVLGTADADLVAGFEPNDILFIDSSHVLAPGTDVDIEFNHLFPRLAPGGLDYNGG
jgi:predicted O-methyltransferase YrrM